MNPTKEQIKALADQFICHSASRSIDEVEMAGGIMIELLESENNLRQQIAHLRDEIAGLNSDRKFFIKQRDELLVALINSVKSLKRANEMGDGPIVDTIWYGPAETLFDYMDAAIASVRGNHAEQPLDMVETTAPALIFYPAGSLGEAVES